MTIELLSTEEYRDLLNLQEKYPKLTFQNKGYEYIDRDRFSEEDKEADETVKEILSKHIEGFVQFNNFLLNKKGELCVRFQYHYSPAFTGVGYITCRELFYGFDTPDSDIENSDKVNKGGQ